MDLADLGTPAQLWRRWVLLAAAYAGEQRSGCEIRRSDGCAHLERAGGWLRMRRLGGNRAVLWGAHPDLDPGADFDEDVLDSAPDWAYDLDSARAHREVGFLAWHAHNRWSSLPGRVPAPVATMLTDLVDDAAVLRWWRQRWPGAAEADLRAVLDSDDRECLVAVAGRGAAARAVRQLALGTTWSSRQISPTASVHLRSQVHAQMRAACELDDRGLPARPSLLRQWSRVQQHRLPFRYAVCSIAQGVAPGFVVGEGAHGLDSAQVRSLENVLMELRMSETDEASGAWLFARVTGGNGPARLDRAFDHWPGWYRAPDTGPTLAALHAEMVQRTPRWRPGWSSLLRAERP